MHHNELCVYKIIFLLVGRLKCSKNVLRSIRRWTKTGRCRRDSHVTQQLPSNANVKHKRRGQEKGEEMRKCEEMEGNICYEFQFKPFCRPLSKIGACRGQTFLLRYIHLSYILDCFLLFSWLGVRPCVQQGDALWLTKRPMRAVV